MGMFSLAQGGHGISSNEGGLLNIPMGDQGSMHDERLAALQARLDDVGTARSWTDVPWGWAQVANTPLRWYKSDAYGGGIRVPLIVRWPEQVPQGQIRDQFHHITDLVPTVLDLLNEEAPKTHNGLAQMPVHGKSLAYTFEDPDAQSNKGVQYFEMWGHRAVWMDGWKAVTRHFRGTPFEEDQWELFNLEEDFSELHDLSGEEPERLQRMIDRWWIEAGRYNVLPLDDRLPTLGLPSPKPGGPHEGLHYRFYPPVSHLHGRVAPVIHIGDWQISAEVERTNTDQRGRPLRLRQHGRRRLALRARQPPLPRLQLPREPHHRPIRRGTANRQGDPVGADDIQRRLWCRDILNQWAGSRPTRRFRTSAESESEAAPTSEPTTTPPSPTATKPRSNSPERSRSSM